MMKIRICKKVSVSGQLPPREIALRLGLGFGLGFGFILRLGGNLPRGTCPRTESIIGLSYLSYQAVLLNDQKVKTQT